MKPRNENSRNLESCSFRTKRSLSHKHFFDDIEGKVDGSKGIAMKAGAALSVSAKAASRPKVVAFAHTIASA